MFRPIMLATFRLYKDLSSIYTTDTTYVACFLGVGKGFVSDRERRYTGWCKKSACFSNNCNFVYFQYKKMLTPKQPVINAVLITYIDYSITENYIGNMAPFLPYTRPQPLLKVLHRIY